MGDALRALIDAVGLQVGPGTEVRSDDEAWTLDVEPTGTHVWVATRSRSVWIRRGDDIAIVDVGTATLGPLADEVLALPPVATTGPPGAPSPDVGLALRHVGHLDGGRWHGAQQQALARLVVTTVLRDNPPPMLGRWYRSLAVRSALTRGDRPSDVATRFGFSTTSSMWRALERVRPPRNRR